MAFQIVLNLIISFVWMFLNGAWTTLGFLSGYILGLLLIAALRRFFPDPLYVIKAWAVVRLIALLLKELVHASVIMISQIIRPRLDIKPGIFAYRTTLNSDWEVTLLCILVSITPGSMPIEVSGNQRTLYIHAMNISEEEEMSERIRRTFEKAIKEVTR